MRKCKHPDDPPDNPIEALQAIVDGFIELREYEHRYTPHPIPDAGIVSWSRVGGENPFWLGYDAGGQQSITIWEHWIERVFMGEKISDHIADKLIRQAFINNDPDGKKSTL